MLQGASGAAAAAPSQGSPQPSSKDGGGVGQNVGSQGAGADAFDYKSAFQSQSKKLADAERNLHGLRQDFDSRKGDMELAGKLRKAFEPETPKAEDPVSGWERELDFYIEQAVEAKNAGRGIPLTANLAISHYKSLIAAHQERQTHKQEIDQLTKQMRELSDPSFHVNQKAYTTLDGYIKQGLDKLYGPGQETLTQKRALFQAIGGQIAGAINEMAQKNPARWDMIRRDPDQLAKIAQRALRMNIPPKAIQLLEEENLRNTDMPLSELRQAFREADSLEDPRHREEVKTAIRRDILVRMHDNSHLRAARG